MSLFSSIHMAGNSLQANDIALQVVGQNITNANTPGYIREEAILKPAGTQKLGGLLLGMGVEIEAVVQKVDKFLQERLRGAVGDNANSQTLKDTYVQLEKLVNGLGDSNLSTSMNNFFNSISDILNQPDDVTVRNMAVLQGDTLTKDIALLSQKVEGLRTDINNRIRTMAGDINRLTETIANLNVKICDAEGGAVSKSEAVGLRDQRYTALEDLAKLIGTRSIEQSDGTVTVYSGGEYLVSAGISRSVEAVVEDTSASQDVGIHLTDNDATIDPTSGELRGQIDARDNVLGGFLGNLDDFAGTLAFEFNKVYSSGQGLSGYTTLTSENGVDDASQPLTAAGLTFTPQNGAFQVLVHNKNTNLTTATDIAVNLHGKNSDTTLNDLKTALNAIDGISAEITSSGQLKIDSLSPDTEFSFANDTSGVLAALGLNVFFSGSSANNLGVSAQVKADPGKFAASTGGIGNDTNNALVLADFLDRPLESRNNESLGALYTSMVDDVTEGSAQAQSTANGSQSFEDSLRAQQTSISGVSLDEEAVKMIAYQRAYQASARYITTLSDLFDILVNI